MFEALETYKREIRKKIENLNKMIAEAQEKRKTAMEKQVEWENELLTHSNRSNMVYNNLYLATIATQGGKGLCT